MQRLAIAVVLLIAFPGCKKAADLAKYKDRATALAAKYSPKVAELSKKLPDLVAHAKDLPVNVPGVDKLEKLIAENKSTLESAQDLLAKLPGKIASDTPEQAEKELADAEKLLAADVATAEQDEAKEAEIETAASNAMMVDHATTGSAAPPAPAAEPKH